MEFDALDAGTAYALMRHGQDEQTAELVAGLRAGGQAAEPEINVEVHIHSEDPEEAARPVNALDYATADIPEDWSDYIGQEPIKQQMSIYMRSAKLRGAALPHVLLASGFPGVGKTTLARLIGRSLGVRTFELVPPFNINTLVQAALQLNDRDILFIDEVHRFGTKGSEILLKILEDKVAFLPTGEVIQLADITIIAATTAPDIMPEAVLDRFKIKPYFQRYSWPELSKIAVQFAARHDCMHAVDDVLAVDIAAACRSTPRIIEEMVIAARDLTLTLGRPPRGKDLLAFLEVEPDGLTRMHIHYITSLRKYFPREARDGGVEYIAGEPTMMQRLRQTKAGNSRLEDFLLEQGLIERTPRGRRLTNLGILRAEDFIAQGKGA